MIKRLIKRIMPGVMEGENIRRPRKERFNMNIYEAYKATQLDRDEWRTLTQIAIGTPTGQGYFYPTPTIPI